MTFLVCVWLAQAPVDGRPEVVDVEIRLPATADPKVTEQVSELSKLVTVRKGQKLSRRAVRRSLESLFESQRFADVVARVENRPGGVAVIFDAVPKLLVAEVFFEGPVGEAPLSFALKADLQAAARLSVGSEYWNERGELASDSMVELLNRRGFRSARVAHSAQETELGLAIGFSVTLGEPTRLQSITIAGEPGIDLRRVLEATGVATGQVLDLDIIERGLQALRELFRKERYFRARVDAPVVFEGGRLVVPIQAGPRYEIVFSGNRRVTDASLLAVLGYEGEETLDEQLASRLADRLARFYRFRGFYDVRVTVSAANRASTAALGFVIEEGDPLRVVDTHFDGSRAIEPGVLREVLRKVIESSILEVVDAHAAGDSLALEGRTKAVFANDLPNPPALSIFEEGAYAEAVKAMTALYRERGYLQALVQLDGVEIRDRKATARFRIKEGAKASFRSVQARGLPQGVRSDAIERATEAARSGSAFSTAALEQLRQSVQRELARSGYLYAGVEAAYSLDTTGRFADCVLTVSPGPQVRVRTLLPVGADRTDEDIILRGATMQEGQALDSESLFTTQSNLLSTGAFKTVEVETLAPERAEPLKTVLLKVKELPRVSGELGLGYFVAEGPRLVLDASAPNLGGKAVNLAMRAQLNWFGLSVPALTGLVDVSDLDAVTQLGGRGNLSVQNRGLLPFDIGWRLDAIGERVFRPQFRFTRWAAIPTIDWTRSVEVPRFERRLKLTVALQYELEWARVQETSSLTNTVPLTFVDQERLRFLFGTFALQTLRLSPTLDFRDNALAPRKGVLLQGAAEVTGALYAGTPVAPGSSEERQVSVSFVKVSALATGYVPLSQRVVLALSLRGGRIAPLVADAVTPPVKRFFLGGATSMRGFNEDQLIAEDQRAQYRGEISDCQVLASKQGCTPAAQTVGAGRQIASQGGEFFALAKAEVRFPGVSIFDLGAFFEAGNLWLAQPSDLLGFGRLRYVVGAGIRYATPIGPLALDVGVNLVPDVLINEPRVVVHFNIGVF